MVDYSKWKNIEISDDEDDTHPNIDTPSLFRWRHQARVERMEEMEREKEEFTKRKQSYQARLIDVKDRIAKKQGKDEDLKKELEEVEKEGRDISRIEEDLAKKEKKTPWNVDTISKPGFEKTVINKQDDNRQEGDLSEAEKENRMKLFVKENEKLCKQYGMMKKYDDSRRFLQQHPQLVSDDTANYLVIWSINLVIEEKLDLMAHVAHQCICMQYILEVAKQLEVDPRACIASFFAKLQNCTPDYREQFEAELQGFKDRVTKRAEEKIKEAAADYEEEERQKRLGPGGLDPADVFDTLPEILQQCFKNRDIELLQKALTAMPTDQAAYHMKRCVDSGLWVPKSAEKEKETIDDESADVEIELDTSDVEIEADSTDDDDEDEPEPEAEPGPEPRVIFCTGPANLDDPSEPRRVLVRTGPKKVDAGTGTAKVEVGTGTTKVEAGIGTTKVEAGTGKTDAEGKTSGETEPIYTGVSTSELD